MDNQEWNFEAPKFWDLLETIPQERPTDAWFCRENVSNPSFGPPPKKRRTLRVFKYDSHSKEKPPPPKRESVFERLSRKSTISFSRKTNQPLTEQQKQHVAHHAAIHDMEDYSDQELVTHSSKETVEERIARLEGTYMDRPFSLGKKSFKLKQNISHSARQPPTQSLFDELSQAEERTQESIASFSTQPAMIYSPIRETIPVSPIVNNQSSYFTPRIEHTSKFLSPLISNQTASPIQKNNSRSSYTTRKDRKKIVASFFEGLLKMAEEREEKKRKAKELRAKLFFEDLLKNTARQKKSIIVEGLTHESTFSNSSELFSPRKRTRSIGASDDYLENSTKRSRFDL